MNNTKPNFSNNELNHNKSLKRPEVGAIWEKFSDKSNRKFLSLQLRFSKAKLLEIINNENKEDIFFNFIAFPNDHHKGVVNRPSFCIYERLQKETASTET